MGKGEGRGEGRGGCGVCEAVGDAIQCISCCLCCCFVLGPVLMIIGIIFISSAFTNGRGERIDEFNASVDTWNSGTVDDFSTSTDWQYRILNSCDAPASNLTLLTLSDTEEMLGAEADEKDVFGAYDRVKFTDDSPPSSPVPASATSCVVSVSILSQGSAVGNVSTNAVEIQDLTFGGTGCSKTQREDRNGRKQYNENSDVSSCQSTCSRRGGTSSGSSYSRFSCTIMDAPAKMCVRVAKNSGGWFIAQGTLPDRPSGASGSGCFREAGGWQAVVRKPFSGGSTTLSIPVEIRHERDPYLYFLDISNGSLNFGLTTGEKLKIGFTLLIIGAIIMTIMCGTCYCIVKFAWSFAQGGKKAERPQNAVGGALYDVSAKYGSFIPGGATAVGVPAHGASVPTGEVQKPPPGINVPPQGYSPQPYNTPGSPPGVSGYPYDHSPYGSPTAAQPLHPNMPPGYGGAGPPPGYGGPPGATQPGYSAPQNYGAAPEYGAQPNYGTPNYGAAPPGYGAAPPGYGAPPPAAAPAGYPTY